ncbi:hypothetical protein Aduo_017266 [Ancylostoma duodenale]
MKELYLVLLIFYLTNVLAQDERRRCGRNEVFDACGSACEPTCRNPNPEVCTLQCVAGCRCRTGFYRNDNKQCVEFENCNPPPRPPPPRPPTAASCSEVRCPAGYHCEMVEFPCTRQPCATPSPRCVPDPRPPRPTTSPPAPEAPLPPPNCDNIRCPPGFFCQVISIPCEQPPCPPPTAQCFREQQNPPAICPINESWRECSSLCEPTCDNRNPVLLIFYLTTVLAQDKRRRCGRNEVFDECGSACEPTCRNPNPEVCTLQCVAGCRCRTGYFRNDNNECVKNCNTPPRPPPTRPPPTRPPPTRPPSAASCSEMRCPPGTHCEMVEFPCTRQPCATPSPRCVQDREWAFVHLRFLTLDQVYSLFTMKKESLLSSSTAANPTASKTNELLTGALSPGYEVSDGCGAVQASALSATQSKMLLCFPSPATTTSAPHSNKLLTSTLPSGNEVSDGSGTMYEPGLPGAEAHVYRGP